MLFSQRYFRAIENNMLVVDIAAAARRKLWAWLSANNASLGIQNRNQQIPLRASHAAATLAVQSIGDQFNGGRSVCQSVVDWNA